MQWDLVEETDKQRKYVNKQTGTETKLDLIYTDKLQNKWWGFRDLLSIPHIRKAFAKSITDLYQAGLSPQDIKTWITKEKTLLRSNDTEKYEKLYALVLEKESLVESVVDPLKQTLALATVYILGDKERIDYFSYDEGANKLEIWKLDMDAEAFFLTWLNDLIGQYMTALKNISQTVSNTG